MKELGFITSHEIRIKATCNMGFIIKIGCAELVASSVTQVLEILDAYFHDSKYYENKYNNLQEPLVEARPNPPIQPSRGGEGSEKKEIARDPA